MTEGRVQGKVAMVTGGASGIGYATASLLHDEGAEVVIADIHEPESYGDMTCFNHDISDEESWKDVMSRTLRIFGKLDVLVNCAGINGVAFNVSQDPEYITLGQFRRVMSINGEGTLLGCKHGIAAMKEKGGCIINVGSLAARLAVPALLDYGCSKAVIRYLTKAVALYCTGKGYNIRCNLITPGATYTPLWDNFFDDGEDRSEKENEIREKIPLKRWGMPVDVAYAILYLASDEAQFVTGADIVVDGGQLVKGQVTRGR